MSLRRQADSASTSSQTSFQEDGGYQRKQPEFKNQEIIVTSIVKNLCGHGGMPVTMVEKPWFRQFMRDVEPRFKSVSRVSVGSKISALLRETKSDLLKEISIIASHGLRPSITMDFWTGRDGRSFMGCTIHYVYNNQLKNALFCFKEVPPPHTSENIRICFEDQLDRYEIRCFQIITDNAANMKRALCTSVDKERAATPEHDKDQDVDDDDNGVSDDDLDEWTPRVLKYDGWLGCTAHQLQLVVHEGYKELTLYRRVQSAFNKAKAVSTLAHKSSHLAFNLSAKIPLANDTRWSSHIRLHEHILTNLENINQALEKMKRSNLTFSKSDKENLSSVVEVMAYFAQATDILQGENMPTSNRVIPVIDSLDNALTSLDRSQPAINALCQRMLKQLAAAFFIPA